MTVQADPYPTNLIDDEQALERAQERNVSPEEAVQYHLVRAVNRLAQAVEQNTLALLHPTGQNTAPQAVPQGLAALPPVQTVADKPACPYHGLERVASSTNGKGGFYCQSKASPGQPANPKGYCTWHS